MARGPMPIVDYQDLYKESGELLRHYLSWREKLLAGYFAVMAGLAIAVGAMQDQFKPIAVLVPLLASILSVVFLLLDLRNQELLDGCVDVGAALERLHFGPHKQLNLTPRFLRHSTTVRGLYVVGGVVSFIAFFMLRNPSTSLVRAHSDPALLERYQLTTSCSEAADRFVERHFQKDHADTSYGYSSHFNSTLYGCFVNTYYSWFDNQPSKRHTLEQVFDASEAHELMAVETIQWFEKADLAYKSAKPRVVYKINREGDELTENQAAKQLQQFREYMTK